MIQNVAQMREVSRSAVNPPIRNGMSNLFTTFNGMEFDKPLYFFTLPGFILMAGGLNMSLNLIMAAYPAGSFDMGGSAIGGVFLLTLTGIFMSFTGILLHSISRLIRYKKINCESLRTR